MSSTANAQPVKKIMWAAYRSGGFVGGLVRPSSHSSSGWVAVVAFRTRDAAVKFAPRAASAVAYPVAVRPATGARFAVSVPVIGPASGAVWCSGIVGGVQGVAAAVRAWAWASAKRCRVQLLPVMPARNLRPAAVAIPLGRGPAALVTWAPGWSWARWSA